MWARWREVDRRCALGRLCAEHKDRVSKSQLSFARLSSVFSNNRNKFVGHGKIRDEKMKNILQQWSAEQNCESLASVSVRCENARPRKRGTLSQKSKQEPISTLSPMTLNRTTTNRRKMRSPPHSRMKTPTCRLRWALATHLNASPRISATQTQKSWSGSSWKSWRGTGRTLEPR